MTPLCEDVWTNYRIDMSKHPSGWGIRTTRSVGQESDADADEDGGQPAAAVDVFVEKELCREGVADEGEGGAGGGGERDVYAREGEEEGEEAERHGEDAEEKDGRGDDGAGGSREAGLGADQIEIADAAHSSGGEHVPGYGGDGDGEDGDPGKKKAGFGVAHARWAMVMSWIMRGGC